MTQVESLDLDLIGVLMALEDADVETVLTDGESVLIWPPYPLGAKLRAEVDRHRTALVRRLKKCHAAPALREAATL
jgi:hypothetical protein